MKNIDLKQIVVLSLRIIPVRKINDFYPFFDAPVARAFILDKLNETFSANPDCLSIWSHLDEIILIWTGEKEKIYESTGKIDKIIRSIINECNQYGQQNGWNYTLGFVLAMDAGLSSPITLPARGQFHSVTLWSGLHVDRASNLSAAMASGNTPHLLITHSFYKHLSPEMQSRFNKLYYILHICCYSDEKTKD